MDFKLRINARYFSDNDLLDDLREVSKSIGKQTVGEREYVEHGKFSCRPLINRFGSWNAALKQAGLETFRETKVSDENLFDNLESIRRGLGRQPFYSEIQKPFSKYSVGIYDNRFGSWMKACKAFIQYKKNDPEFIKIFKPKSNGRSRTVNDKRRLQVWKRDNHTCVICGRSPATQLGIILHVDHKIPFSEGGDSSLENLRTLCSICNLGKGNDNNL